ncbi:hypothetical protein ACTFIR_007898 [Dictyostelium discoideum]
MKYLITLLFIFILFNFINSINAYKDREIVRTHLQTIIGTSGTVDNHDISTKLAPRFKRDLSKSLLAVDSKINGKKVDILPQTLYRILFSFDNDKFKTSWITICDGNGTYLNQIDFSFTYSNDKILDLKWHLDYNTEEVHHKKKPNNFYINYKWKEIKDKDISSGLFILFLFGILISSVSVIYIIFQFTGVKPSKSLPSYYQALNSNFNNNNNNNNNSNGNNSYNRSYQQNSSLPSQQQQQQQYNLSPQQQQPQPQPQQQQQQQYYQEDNFIDTSANSRPPTKNINNLSPTTTTSHSFDDDDDEQQPDISEMESL